MVADAPVDGDKYQGIGQRAAGISEERLHHLVVEQSVDGNASVGPGQADATKQDAQHTAQYVHEQRVHTERLEEQTPALVTLHVDNPDEQGQQTGGQTTGGKHEGGRPYLLVERASVTQQQAAEGKDGTCQEQLDEVYNGTAVPTTEKSDN